MNGFTKDIDIDLYYSDNYFISRPIMALKDGSRIIKTDEFMYVSCAKNDDAVDNLCLHVSTWRTGFRILKPVSWPYETLL